MTEASNDRLQQELLKGTIDIAIADFPKSLSGIILQDFYYEEVVLLIEKGLFNLTFGKESELYLQQFAGGNFAALKDCPLVLGGTGTVDRRIGLEVMKQYGINEPIIRARSNDSNILLKLAAQGMGGCFCPKYIVQASLTEKQKQKMLTFSLGNKARYPIRFGYKESSYQWSVIEKFLDCAIKAALKSGFPVPL